MMPLRPLQALLWPAAAAHATCQPLLDCLLSCNPPALQAQILLPGAIRPRGTDCITLDSTQDSMCQADEIGMHVAQEKMKGMLCKWARSAEFRQAQTSLPSLPPVIVRQTCQARPWCTKGLR